MTTGTTYDPITGCDLPDPWRAMSPGEIAEALNWGGWHWGIIANMAAELLHLRRKRDELLTSNAALIERARKAEGEIAAGNADAPYRVKVDPHAETGGFGTPPGVVTITDRDGNHLFSSYTSHGTKVQARHLVNAAADVAILRGRVETTAGDAKRLRHEVTAWRRASGCESPASLEAIIADIRGVLASPIVYDATATKQFLAAMRGLKQRTRAAEDALAAQSAEIDRLRGQANPTALAQAKDAEEKRAQWQHRAECGETKIAELTAALAESAGTAAVQRDRDLLMGSILGLASRINLTKVLPETAIDAATLLTEIGDYYLCNRDRAEQAEGNVNTLIDWINAVAKANGLAVSYPVPTLASIGRMLASYVETYREARAELAEYKHEFGPVRQGVEARASLLRGLSGATKALRRPKVGLAVLVRRADGCLLMVRRKGAHGSGTWSFPGGHLEPGELPTTCAARELAEEAGIHAANVRMLGVWTYTDFGDDVGAYITLYAVVDVPEWTEFTNREPDKCHAGVWVPQGNPYPAPLFEPLSKFLGLGVDPYTVQPGHPMLAAALGKLGVADIAAFVGAVKMGGAK